MLNKGIEMEQLRRVRFIKAPLQHFGSYFCLGVYMLMHKTTNKVKIKVP